MKSKIWILLFIVIMALPIVIATQEVNNPFKQNTCVQLVQSCDNCTYVNFTSVSFPDGKFTILNIAGEKHSTDFNMSFCNTSQIGTYIIRTAGDLNGVPTNGNFNIYINPSGSTFNNVIYEYLFFVLITLIFYTLLYFGYIKQDLTITMIVAFGVLLLGVYISQYGIANLNNGYTQAFSIINIGIGAYILIRGGISFIEELDK